jgi:hypothetical protein
MSTPAERPRQVTTAAWLIMVGSVLLVFGAFETISGLHSLETRKGILRALAEAPLSGTGLDLDAVRAALRVSAMVLGACAATTAILGFYVLRRDSSARLVLTVLAAPLVIAGFATDPFLAPMVGAAIGMLWVQPARGWFAGAGASGP